jgi:hypothetical protein
MCKWLDNERLQKCMQTAKWRGRKRADEDVVDSRGFLSLWILTRSLDFDVYALGKYMYIELYGWV